MAGEAVAPYNPGMGTTDQTGRDMVPGFGPMIRSARLAREWSMDELAAVADVAQNTVSAIEREVRAPSLRVAAALVWALGLRVWLHDPGEAVRMLESPPEKPGKKNPESGKGSAD